MKIELADDQPVGDLPVPDSACDSCGDRQRCWEYPAADGDDEYVLLCDDCRPKEGT